MAKPLELHGRSTFRAVATYTDDDTGMLVDLTGKALFVELATIPEDETQVATLLVRKPVVQCIVHLTRADIALLPADEPAMLTVIDETIEGDEQVIGEQVIQRVGYVV